MSDLVGNPEDRFSHNEAHIVCNISCPKQSRSFDVIVLLWSFCLPNLHFINLYCHIETTDYITLSKSITSYDNCIFQKSNLAISCLLKQLLQRCYITAHITNVSMGRKFDLGPLQSFM